MIKNKIIINQPAGLGDIFFCQKIAETFLYNEYEVIWPVNSAINWIGEYLINSSTIKYINKEEYKPEQNDIVINLDGAQNITGGLIMPSKYDILNIEWEDWVDYFNFKRNKEKEDNLYYDILKLQDNENYTFINKYYGTPPHYLEYNIKENYEGKIVNLEMLDNFTIFDWCKVIENANRISIVDTSLNYIIEKINIKSKEMLCYCRHGEFTYNQILFLFKKPWKYLWN
jgi:hypothetical protein